MPATTLAELTAGSRGVIISPLESIVSSALDNAIPRLVSAITVVMRQETGGPSAPFSLAPAPSSSTATCQTKIGQQSRQYEVDHVYINQKIWMVGLNNAQSPSILGTLKLYGWFSEQSDVKKK